MRDQNTEKKNAKQEKTSHWEVQKLIAELDAGPNAPGRLKQLLNQVLFHTNHKKGFAWAAQGTLAKEMSCSVPTIERAFSRAKQLGVLHVRRIRTGKGKADQYNEYWLDIDRLKQLQTKPEHPSVVMAANADHPSSVMAAENEAPIKNDSSTHQNQPEHPSKMNRAPITGDGIVFELKQYPNNAVNKTAVKAKSKPDAATSAAGVSELRAHSENLINAHQPEADWKLDRYQIQTLRRHAKERGIDAAMLRAYILPTFKVTCYTQLTLANYHSAMDHFHTLPRVN